MTKESRVNANIQEAEELKVALHREKTQEARLRVLKAHKNVQSSLKNQIKLKTLIYKLKNENQEILLTLIALNQFESVFSHWDEVEDPAFSLIHLCETLKPLKKHYKSIGGLVGYMKLVLMLIVRERHGATHEKIDRPLGTSINAQSLEIYKFEKMGIKHLPFMGEVYPVGGAADRFNLRDEKTGEALPQAKLQFEGHTLLEGLIRDLQARERLYEKVTGKKALTPIALMTSPEKQNTFHIQQILEDNKWFGRPKELFYLFEQPLVPVISNEGFLATKGPLMLDMKPGGHGVIWHLMETYGVFKWFKDLGRANLILRQINNPLAGTDNNLLTLFGKGSSENKSFGFLSCPRNIGAPEGMNVILTTKNEDGYHTSLTNIEYTDFKLRGVDETKDASEIEHSKYPANTNILFASIKEIKKALKKIPLPGLILNLKNEVEVFTENGERKKTLGGRLETTMQNIADAIQNTTLEPPTEKDLLNLKSFLLLNNREKTIAATKNNCRLHPNTPDTPTKAWITKQKIAYELFTNLLNFDLPIFEDNEPPTYIITYHPALGPLWSVIAQKIQTGSLKNGSELNLEIDEVYIEKISIDGSCYLISKNLQGKAFLKNVTIKNEGLNLSKSDALWTGDLAHKEKFEVILEGQSEFYAEDVEFEGPFHFVVPDGHKMTAKSVKGKIKTTLEKISTPSWKWGYSFSLEGSLLLTFNS